MKEMPFLEHIQDLRKHAVRALIWLILGFFVAMGFMKPLLGFLKLPLNQTGVEELISLDVFEVIMMNMKVCFITSLFIAFPILLIEIWKFIAPGLYDHEKKILKPILFFSLILFYLGIAFSFFYVVPFMLKSTFEWAKDYAHIQITYSNYFHTLIIMLLCFGGIFQVPNIISVLGLARVITAKQMKSHRKILFLGSFIVGLLIAPPDVTALVIVALPLYAMCEISIQCLEQIEKRQPLKREDSAS